MLRQERFGIRKNFAFCRYDNEAGYSRRLLDLVAFISKKDASA